MARRGESKAFGKGLRLGAITAAGVVLWNAPQSGARTREQIIETFESFLFTVLDMPTKVSGKQDSQQTDRLPIVVPAPKLQRVNVEADSTPGEIEPAQGE
jgi:gas vesicle protein